jgi:hypothetical protein
LRIASAPKCGDRSSTRGMRCRDSTKHTLGYPFSRALKVKPYECDHLYVQSYTHILYMCVLDYPSIHPFIYFMTTIGTLRSPSSSP